MGFTQPLKKVGCVFDLEVADPILKFDINRQSIKAQITGLRSFSYTFSLRMYVKVIERTSPVFKENRVAT